MKKPFESIFKGGVRSVAASIPGAASLAQVWSEVEQHDMGKRVIELETKYTKMNNEVSGQQPKQAVQGGWLRPTHEFMRRTCKVGVMNGKRFKVLGFCCVIDNGVALTSDIVVQNADAFVTEFGGETQIMSQTGFVPIKVDERSEPAPFRVIRFGEFDNSYWDSISDTPSTDLAPEMSPVVLRRIPVVGEELAICIGSESLEEIILLYHCECVRFSVVAPLRTEPISLSFHLMSPYFSRPEYPGGPCFDRDGRLVGIVADVLLDPNGGSYRPVIGNFIEILDSTAKYMEESTK